MKLLYWCNQSFHTHLYLPANTMYSEFLIFLTINTSSLSRDCPPSKHARPVHNSPIGYLQVFENAMF